MTRKQHSKHYTVGWYRTSNRRFTSSLTLYYDATAVSKIRHNFSESVLRNCNFFQIVAKLFILKFLQHLFSAVFFKQMYRTAWFSFNVIYFLAQKLLGPSPAEFNFNRHGQGRTASHNPLPVPVAVFQLGSQSLKTTTISPHHDRLKIKRTNN